MKARYVGIRGGVAALFLIYLPSAWSLTFTVDTTVDGIDAKPGDGTCKTVGGKCSLRAAIQESNASPGLDTINIPEGTYKPGQSLYAPKPLSTFFKY